MCTSLYNSLHINAMELASSSPHRSPSKKMASEAATQQQLYGELNLEGKITEIHNQSIIFSLVIFSFLAFFALCFLYTLYLCTHRWQHAVAADPRQPMAQAATNHSASIQIGPFFGPEAGLAGLDAAAINSLPIVPYGSANLSKEVDCSICLGSFQYGEKVKLLPQCCHVFHSQCLDKWLVAQSNCPLCRAQVHSADPAR